MHVTFQIIPPLFCSRLLHRGCRLVLNPLPSASLFMASPYVPWNMSHTREETPTWTRARCGRCAKTPMNKRQQQQENPSCCWNCAHSSLKTAQTRHYSSSPFYFSFLFSFFFQNHIPYYIFHYFLASNVSLFYHILVNEQTIIILTQKSTLKRRETSFCPVVFLLSRLSSRKHVHVFLHVAAGSRIGFSLKADHKTSSKATDMLTGQFCSGCVCKSRISGPTPSGTICCFSAAFGPWKYQCGALKLLLRQFSLSHICVATDVPSLALSLSFKMFIFSTPHFHHIFLTLFCLHFSLFCHFNP